MTIIAAADGSALGNPGPAGWAWYVNDECWAAGGWPRGTNNQGELMAVIDLFEATAHMPGEDLRVLCDSQYVINAVTKWMPGWKRKGWRKADGSPVLNLELLKRLDAAIVGRRFTFEWVKGHAGHELNEAADERARGAATAYQNRTSVPSGPGWPGAAARTPAESAALDAVTPASALELDIFAAGDDTAPTDGPDIAAVMAKELALGAAAARGDTAQLERLLHAAAEQIHSTGGHHNRSAFVHALLEDADRETLIADSGTRLAEGTVLVTFHATSGEKTQALGSSLWLRVGDDWVLRFRQSTPAS